MDTIHRLRTALAAFESGAGTADYDNRQLFNELITHKSRLIQLFDVGPRNAQEQREIESGKTTLRGRQVAVNSDFARQAIFLARELDCSERYIAEILHRITTQNPHFNAVAATEALIVEFHRRRRDVAESLLLLLQAVDGVTGADPSDTLRQLAGFVYQQLLPGDATTGSQVALAIHVFTALENLNSLIANVQLQKQNARSNTTDTAGQGTPSLGSDILTTRLNALKYERTTLAGALVQIVRLSPPAANDLKRLIEWLSANPNHAISFHILAAVLISFDVTSNPVVSALSELIAKNATFSNYMRTKLAPSTPWKDSSLKAVVLLKWTLFCASMRHTDERLEDVEGFKSEQLETQIWNAVQGDAFAYLILAATQVQGGRHTPQASYAGGALGLSLSPEQEQQREAPASEDFRAILLDSFETLIRLLITYASSELRKIKQRQEDLVLATRSDRARHFRTSSTVAPAADADASHQRPRNDVAVLYSFIGVLYSLLPPERALQYWGSTPPSGLQTHLEVLENNMGKLPTFLQWAVWSTQSSDVDMTTALYDMLVGLAHGQFCSELAYNFMARGTGEVIAGSMLPTPARGMASGPTISWSLIFDLLVSWAAASSSPSSRIPEPAVPTIGFGLSQGGWAAQSRVQAQQQQQFQLGQRDVLLAQSFLRFLATVVKFSVAVRLAVAGHVQFRAVPTLVSLIPLRLPLELKGAVFDTLAAFCEPSAGAPGVEICQAVWTLMERYEVINVRHTSSGRNQILKGVEIELEEVEALHRSYPATIPFLKLLATLIHTSKRLPMKERISGVESTSTIPESLGQSYRLPGIAPFTSFVIDNVFARISSLEYAQPSDRWQINDLCLSFIERALASYNLESLVSALEDPQLRTETIMPLLIHPGYDVMKRMLSNTPLQASILSYIAEGGEGFDNGLAREEPYFHSTIVRAMRIVLRVLEIQDIFVDVLIPFLSETDSSSIVGKVQPQSYYTRIDQALAYASTYPPAIAAYVNYVAYPELVLLSVKIVSVLSTSSVFVNLKSLVERSNESERILAGYRRILSSQSVQPVQDAELLAEQSTGAGAEDPDKALDLDQAIRLAALDLLLDNTAPNRAYPNVAYFLLFGEGDGDQLQIQDPHALGARRVGIHTILDLLDAGIPDLDDADKEDNTTTPVTALFMTLPLLAERCYRLIYQLCVHPRSSDFTMRYLRTREHFFSRHLAAMPAAVAPFEGGEDEEEPVIEVLYNEGTRVTTTAPALSSFLRLRSHVLDLVAIELHVLTQKGQLKGVTVLLDILLSGSRADASRYDENNALVFGAARQTSSHIIDLAQSLNFEWVDSLTVQPVTLEFLSQLNLNACMRTDANGCEIVDRSMLLSLLSSAKKTLHAQGRLVTSAHTQQFQAEVDYILQSCAIENHRREVVHAVAVAYESWRRVLDMALTKCFARLPYSRREAMLFEVLNVVPACMRSPDMQQDTAVLLSEVILSAVTKLREDRSQQIILQAAGDDNEAGALPAERLYSVLRDILDCTLSHSRSELVRGNLYATILNYLYLIRPASASAAARSQALLGGSVLGQSLSTSLAGSTSGFRDSMSAIVPRRLDSSSRDPSPIQSVEIGSLAILKSVGERLVSTIARDAIDGLEVWKTVAFMLLDSLIQLSRVEKQHIVLTSLVRHGILSNFVHGLLESDTALQAVLKPDPDDLNALYVYEAKMSLFIRIAQTRAGAERLLESQLIPTLAQCDFLDARPEADQTFMDRDTFLPSAIQRYHQLFMPALQAVHALVSSLGSKHVTALEQVLEFITSHRETVIILLKHDIDDETPVAVLDEIHLLLSLCNIVLPIVPEHELQSAHSRFGGIHHAILALSSLCLSVRYTRLAKTLVPQTDAEMFSASMAVYGAGSANETKFSIEVRESIRRLQTSVIIYLSTASNAAEPELSPVLLPITSSQRADGRFSATVPTIGDALDALSTLCVDLATVIQQIAGISAELSAREQIRVDRIREIIHLPPSDEHILQELDIRQKRALLARELVRIRGQDRTRAQRLLTTLEITLLLLWRHAEYFTNSDPTSAAQSRATAGAKAAVSSLKASQSVDVDGVRSALLRPLQRLSSLELTEDALGPGCHDTQGYIDIMIRRLKEVSGVLT